MKNAKLKSNLARQLVALLYFAFFIFHFSFFIFPLPYAG
jgi:hypothetical protein